MPPQSALLRTAFRQWQQQVLSSSQKSKFMSTMNCGNCVNTITGTSGTKTARVLASHTQSQFRRVFSTASQSQSQERVQESFLNGTSSVYAEQMFELYQHDPSSVHASWKKYFDDLEQGVAFSEADYQNPTTAAAARKVAVRSLQKSTFSSILPTRTSHC